MRRLVSLLWCVCLASFLATAAEAPAVLHPLNTLDGVSETYLRGAPRRLELVTGENDTTDGGGAILFGGRAPTGEGSKYFGIMVTLPEPVDLREQAVTLDARTPSPGATKAFYVRLYNEGGSKPAWSFNSWNGSLNETWRTFTLQQGLCLDGLAWEKGVVEDRVADRVDRVEFIIGTRDDDTDVLAVVDNLRVTPRKPGIQDLTAPKQLVRDTPVVVGGKPVATVLHPDSDAGRAAAAAVVAMVRERTGVTLPARTGTPKDRQPSETTFVVGNVFTNPAMLLLYSRQMTPVDAICPGTGGALVHTVFDPFGKGVNAVVVGASDDAGLLKAVELLRGVIDQQPKGKGLTLPRIFERAYAEDFLGKYGWADDEPAADRLEKGLAEGQAALDTGKHTSIAGVLANAATRYQLTGHSVEAKLYVRLWDLYQSSAVADPRKFGGAWGFDSDFRSRTVVPGWRNIEYDPALTDDERLATTKAMGRWLSEAVVPSCAGAVGSTHVPHNHQTFPALGTLFAGLYFTEGFDVAEGGLWLRIADTIFQRQATYYKPYEDCNGYQWLTNGHLMLYTVARPDFAFYEDGNAKRLIDFCIGNMDNLGYQVPYGDTGSWKCWDSEILCLDVMAFATGDTAAAWAADFKRSVKGTKALYSFQRPAVETEPPEGYNGVKLWLLEPQYYHTHGGDARPELAACFDKISFRESMDPAAAYLLLDGLSNGGHKHFDGNSVPRLTQFNRIWLADNDYYKSAVKFHNSMMVFKDGESAPIPPYVEYLSSGETKRYGFSRTRVRDYAGVDWERTILWAKELRAFVFLDKLTALEANEYQFRALWHGIGKAALGDGGFLLEQDGPSMRIDIAPGPELRLYNDAELGANWAGYEHADPVVRSLSAIATVHLEEGESYCFASVFHGAPEAPAEPWQVAFSADGEVLLLQTEAGPVAVGLPSHSLSQALSPLTTDAEILVADPHGLSPLHATVLKAGDDVLHTSQQPQSVDLAPQATAAALSAIPLRGPVPNLAVGGAAPAHEELWRSQLLSESGAACQVTRLATALLDGPGEPATLLAATKEGVLFAIGPDGETRWRVELKARLNDVTADDLTGDGIDEIVVGRQDHQVTVLDAAGRELWSRTIEYYRKPPYVNVVRTGDLDGDGIPEVVIGGENWRFYAFKADGTELWNYESVHPSRSGAVADLDGDGKAEVLCGTHYYYFSALNPDGTRRWRHNFGPICYDIVTGSFEGNQTRGVVCGGGDGCVHYLAHDGQLRMKYNTGDEVKHVRASDLDGDGKDEIIAGSLSHSVYCFGADAHRRWRVDLGAPVSALAVVPGDEAPVVLAGSAAGKLVSVDRNGAILHSTTMPGPPLDFAALDARSVAVAFADGLLAVAAGQ
jgi:FG-GAP-like repeat